MIQEYAATDVLAALLGLYFVAAGIGLGLDRDAYLKMLGAIKSEPVLSYFAGIFAFSLGGAIVATHNDWSGPMAAFVSLVGWIALFEGVFLIAFRGAFVGLLDRITLTPVLIRVFSAGTLLIGFALLFVSLVL